MPFLSYCDRSKGSRLLMSSKYCCVKSLNVYNFRVSGSTLLARRASCQGDLLALHKNSLALGKRAGVLSRPENSHSSMGWHEVCWICSDATHLLSMSSDCFLAFCLVGECCKLSEICSAISSSLRPSRYNYREKWKPKELNQVTPTQISLPGVAPGGQV